MASRSSVLPLTQQLDVVERRSRGFVPAGIDPVSLRQFQDIQSTARQLAEERDRWLANRDRDAEPLQFLVDTQSLLLDRADERRRLLGLVDELARAWTLLAGRMLQQEQLRFAEFGPFLEAFPNLAARLIAAETPTSGRGTARSAPWASLLPALEAIVTQGPRPPGMNDPGLTTRVLVDGWAAGLQFLALSAEARRTLHAETLCGVLFRDVGWLSLATHAQHARTMGPARQAWLFAQHPAIGAALWDAVAATPLVVRAIAGGHHERLNGRGLRRWPAGRQTASVQFAAAAARLIELIRLAEGVVEISVADLRAEAEMGIWSASSVEALLAPGVVFAPIDALGTPEPTAARPNGTTHDLHKAQPLQGPHTTDLDSAADRSFTSVQFVSASGVRPARDH
jgi:hypothetical protein